jgi:hypothetical protein
MISGRVDVASIGEYSVQLHASDGAATTTQSMKWNVVDGVSTTRNLTPLAALSQSSVRYDADAYRAADGLLGSYFVESYGVQYSRGATHTASEQNAWWEADLAEVMHVQEIVVWNRADCCRDRLNDFHVLLSRDPFVTRDLDSTLAQPGVLDLHRPNAAELRNHFDVGEDARFVRVQLSEKNFLNLGEVEILGRNVAPGQRYAYAEKAAPVGQEVTVLSLEAPYPNPFANAVSIDYTLERQQRVTVSIYNALGQMVSVLQDGEAEGGRHRLSWNGLDATGRSVADGVYFVVLQTEREGLNRSIAKVR